MPARREVRGGKASGREIRGKEAIKHGEASGMGKATGQTGTGDQPPTWEAYWVAYGFPAAKP